MGDGDLLGSQQSRDDEGADERRIGEVAHFKRYNS